MKRAFISTFLSSVAVFGVVVALYVLANWLQTPLDKQDGHVAYVTGTLLICINGGFYTSVIMLIWLAFKEQGDGLFDTPFYLPQILKHICLFAVTLPGSITGIDFIYHHGHSTIKFFADPEDQILIRLFYVGILITSLWFQGTWVVTSNRNHKTAVRRIIVVLLLSQIIIIAGSVGIYVLGRTP